MASSADHLCSAPSDHVIGERKTSTFDPQADLQEGLKVKDRSFKQQYASLYFVRLLKLRKAILEAAKLRWDPLPEKPAYIPKVLDVQQGMLCYVIGTVYMDMRLKPNILKDLSEESSIVAPPVPEKYRSQEDKCSLEDESGRIELVGSALAKEYLVTGMVVGILGKETDTGAFEVIEVCYPGVAEQRPLQLGADTNYVAVLSGLNIGEDATSDLKTQLLIEFLTGELGSSQDQLSVGSISRVIIAGNSLATRKPMPSSNTTKKYGYDAASYDATPMNTLDNLLEELCCTVDVDLMPGKNDPVNLHLPQQPMHPLMFTQAHTYSTFHSVTNPYWCEVDGVLLLGTSGQNLDDIDKYVDTNDRLSMAERSLFWRHMAPSAPDTLWCYPFQDRDPFLLETCPHVYFIGNQPNFETSILEGSEGQKIRVVTVPSFEKTGTIVLINLRTLDCSAVRFDQQGGIHHSNDEPMDESK